MKLSKRIENKISNKWLAENLKHLPLLVFICFCWTALNCFSRVFVESHSETTKSTIDQFIWGNISFWITVILISLCAINAILLIKKVSFFNNRSWRIFLGKFIALIIGVSIGTIFIHQTDKIFDHYALLKPRDKSKESVLIIAGHRMSDLESEILWNNIFGLIIGVPIFISQSRKRDIEIMLKEKINHLQQVQTKSQLELLQSKINPHFLYNSLNSIASLAHESPEKVEKMAIGLSKLFRYSISNSSNNLSSIREEIDIVKTYLDIEKIRFEDKLNFSIQLNVDENILIPRFLLQPLVENAIKHGVSKITKPGEINVIINKAEQALEIFIQDNGPEFSNQLMSGYGLQSTTEKLNLLYPDNYELNLMNQPRKQVKIVLQNNIA